jgi:hypothetical protein
MAQGQAQFHRPLGVTLLALGAFLLALYEVWRIAVFLGIASFNFVGQTVSFPQPQWGQALWALIILLIWVWVGLGFWRVRAYAVQFGIFISLFTLIWGFFSILFGSSVENETIPWLLAGAIFLYLSYPGVQKAFYDHEMALMTPEQRAAYDQMQAAQAAMAQATYSRPAPPAPPSMTDSGS